MDHQHTCTGCGATIPCPEPWCLLPELATCETCAAPATAAALAGAAE